MPRAASGCSYSSGRRFPATSRAAGGSTDLRPTLARLARFYGFDPDRLWGVRGYHLPVRQVGGPLVAGNILLAGDAAGLLDPLTGEGIHAAIWSGLAAGRHLAAYLSGAGPDLLGYARDVEGELGPDLRVAVRLHALIHHAPALFVGSVRHVPPTWWLVCRVLRGDQTYADAVRRFRWAARFVPRGPAVGPCYARSSRGRISRPAITSHNPR